MPKFRRTRATVLAVALAISIAGCSSLGGAFGGRAGDLVNIPGIESYAGERALTEAKVQFRRGNYGHSATLYKRAVEANPGDAVAMAGLAASYDRLQRFDLADRVYAELYGLTGGTAQYYNNVGYSYMLRGDLAAARTNFLKAYERDPENVVVANNLKMLGSSVAMSR